MRVLGVDPGSRVCGYGVLSAVANRQVVYIECGVLTANLENPIEQRLAEIGESLSEIIAEMKPVAMALEDVFTNKNQRSALALAQARGMVLAIAGMAGLPVFSYPPAVVKKTVTGRGRAPKDQVAKMVMMQTGLRQQPRSDAADALAVALTYTLRECR